MYKLLCVLIVVALVTACHPRARYQTISLAPDARQMLFTHERGSPKGLICNTVDTSPLPYYTYDDLPGDTGIVGFISSDKNTGLRRRCRRDRNSEFYSFLIFDLSPVQLNPPDGVLYRVTLSGEERDDEANKNCGLRRETLVSAIIQTWQPLSESFEPNPRQAIEIGDLDIDGEPVSLRRRLRNYTNVGIRSGSAPNFVYSWTEESVRDLNDKVHEYFMFYPILIVGQENRDITKERYCLAHLSNLRLNLIYRVDE